MNPNAPAPEPVIDPDLLAWIDEALAPEAPDPALALRVKRQLLRRIAEDSVGRHLTVPPGADGWTPFGPGLAMKVLHREGDVMSYLVRLAPGAALPAHRHPRDEECVVLEGEMRIADTVIPAGGYHLGRQGVLHGRLESPGGALIFLRGAAPEAAQLL